MQIHALDRVLAGMYSKQISAKGALLRRLLMTRQTMQRLGGEILIHTAYRSDFAALNGQNDVVHLHSSRNCRNPIVMG